MERTQALFILRQMAQFATPPLPIQLGISINIYLKYSAYRLHSPQKPPLNLGRYFPNVNCSKKKLHVQEVFYFM